MDKQGRFWLALCLGLMAAVLFLVGASARAQSDVVFVAPGGDCGGATPCYDSIQLAVADSPAGSTVKVAQGTYTRGAFYVLNINKGITVVGGYSIADWQTSLPETQPTVLDGGGVSGCRGIYVRSASDAPIRLEGLVVQRGHSGKGSDGGGIYVAVGNVTIDHCRILTNTATGSAGGGGGGVFLEDGSLTINACTIRNNQSSGYGGGLEARKGQVVMTDSLVEDNTSTEDGGGVMVNGAEVTLRRNTIRGNSPMGVFVAAGSALLEGNTIENNTSEGNGGGIGLDGLYPTSLTARDNLIRNNSAESGGGVGVTAGSLSLYGNDVVSNTATSNGGGIAAWANGSQITLVGNRLTANSSSGLGGGALYVGDGNLTLERNLILNNQAPGSSGGAMVIAGGHVVGINDVIAKNLSLDEGVYLSGGTLVARHWTMNANGDYAVLAQGGEASLTNTIVSSHTVAGFWGSGVVADRTLFFKNGTRCNNGASCGNYISGTPFFVDPAAGDYHITAQSLALDAGIDVGVRRDMDYEPRLGTPDLGADEYWAPGALTYVYVPLILREAP